MKVKRQEGKFIVSQSQKSKPKSNVLLEMEKAVSIIDTVENVGEPTEQVEKVKKKLNKKWVVGLISLLIGIFVIFMIGMFMNKPQPSQQETATATSNVKTEQEINKSLENIAKATTLPYVVDIKDIGGGYRLSTTTYYPNDDLKKYIDYEIHASEKQNVVDDDMSKKIQEQLKSQLPKINDTITVKDGSKVSLETYKHEENYVTILLYDKKPFAYIVTDKQGISISTVTTYYASDVKQ